jgi:hypothetical protein
MKPGMKGLKPQMDDSISQSNGLRFYMKKFNLEVGLFKPGGNHIKLRTTTSGWH